MLPVHFSSAESLKMFMFFSRVCRVSLCILIERSFGFLTPESYLFGASFGGRFNLKSKFCWWSTSGGRFSLVSCCWPLFIPFLHTLCCPKLRGCTKKLLYSWTLLCYVVFLLCYVSVVDCCYTVVLRCILHYFACTSDGANSKFQRYNGK